jgi:hypothetical protein
LPLPLSISFFLSQQLTGNLSLLLQARAISRHFLPHLTRAKQLFLQKQALSVKRFFVFFPRESCKAVFLFSLLFLHTKNLIIFRWALTKKLRLGQANFRRWRVVY